MTSHERLRECAELIDQMLDKKLAQDEIVTMYDEMVDMYMKEMSTFVQEIKNTPKSKKPVWLSRYAFWDESLSDAWKTFHEAERVFLKSNK